ncbi:hypothetical protein DCAR_0831517 [Daucus carota subsp. sativus]|uniref:Uncharacterized protein n=1 Tax=Daucus carota subsp. sativus TaxID=79200 RepID=A0A175YMR6_DAUCS|nr:hypothetical protein DCAR_0831517 [Daucus carota subsp. sativus]
MPRVQIKDQAKQATTEAKAASAAGTNNAVPALSIVGDGAGAPTSRAAVTPTLEQATRTMKTTVRTEASFKLSITKITKIVSRE